MTSQLSQVTLVALDGACAAICHHGAHIVSWKPAGGSERLFLSPASDFEPGTPIRGGVPVIFPQFSGLGSLPKHGFARLHTWEAEPPHIGSKTASQNFTLRSNDVTRQLWPHAFQCDFHVRVGGPCLEMILTVQNVGVAPFTFTAALHTYFQVADVLTTTVDGLAGTRYHDTTVNPWAESMQAEPAVRFAGGVDRIYYDAPRTLTVCTPEQVIQVESSGFPDAVVWNPGPEKCARLPDMLSDGYRRFVCVEAAVIGQAVALAPGGQWHGTQTLIAQ